MFHNKAYRKLGRTHTHRLATLRALSSALFERERIRTTLMKAKELRPFAEKLITKSKRDTLHARRLVGRHIQDRTVAKKLFDTLSARYTDRNGGYMRILKLGRRQGDRAEMAIVELIGSEPVFEKKGDDKKKRGLASRIMGRRRKEADRSEQEAPSEEQAEASPAPEGSSGEEKAVAARPRSPGKKTAARKTPKDKPKKKPAKGAKNT